jgi:hypothetical protein
MAQENKPEGDDELEYEGLWAATTSNRDPESAHGALIRSPQHARSPSEGDLARALERLRHAILRGAASGAALRGGLHLLSLLLALGRGSKRRGHVAPPDAPGSELTVRQALADTVRWAAFLASFGGVYVGVEEGLQALFGRQR